MKEVTIIWNVQITKIVQFDNNKNLDYMMTDEYKRNIEQAFKKHSSYDDVLITDIKIFEHELGQGE